MKKRTCDICNQEILRGSYFYSVSSNHKGLMKRAKDLCLDCYDKVFKINRNESSNQNL